MGEDKEQADKIFLLKNSARGLYTSLQQLRDESADDERRKQVDQTLAKSRELFQMMKIFISSILYDLDGTRVQLNRCSDQVLNKVSEQLNKVNESTQNAVQSVLNRVDAICDKQNDVFQQLSKLKESLHGLAEGREKTELTEMIAGLEALEGEIQLETFEIMNEMQFQDITCQQLQQANQLLDEAKAKLTDFHKLFTLFKADSATGLIGDEEEESKPRTYDPNATMENREERQDFADEIEAGFNRKSSP